MIYAHDHLVRNKNKDDAHRSIMGTLFDSSHELSIWRRSKAIEYSGEIEYVGCCNAGLCCCAFFLFSSSAKLAWLERQNKSRNISERERERCKKKS